MKRKHISPTQHRFAVERMNDICWQAFLQQQKDLPPRRHVVKSKAEFVRLIARQYRRRKKEREDGVTLLSP